jgi:hypothetical protein
LAIRALAHNGYLDEIEEPLARFTAFVADLHSNRARRWLAELHGTVARTRHDWVEAVRWYDIVTKSGGGRLRNWRDCGGGRARLEMPVPDPDSRGDDSRGTL